MIFYNQVYQYADKEDKNRIRIIEINPPVVHFVVLHGDTSMPKEIKAVNLEMEIQNSILLPIPDPYSTTYMDKDLTETQIQKRDEDWALVSMGWEKYKDELLNKRKRNSIFNELVHKYSVSNVKVKRAFTRFWQRGLSKNALLPDYMYSGGRGKERQLSLNAKVGRPRTYSFQGINITEDVKNNLVML